MNEDPRIKTLVRRIEGPLDPASTRAAEDRVWRRLREGHALPGRSWIPGAIVAFVAVLVIAGGAYLDSFRLDVASGGIPILYQEQVAKVDLSAKSTDPVADLANGTLEIRQGHFGGQRPELLRVVAIDDVRLFADALPATIEIRYREQGSVVSGTLARTADISEIRRTTGDARHSVIAPLPPVSRGDVRVFEVWLHVDTARGAFESATVVVEVRGAAEGERARILATR